MSPFTKTLRLVPRWSVERPAIRNTFVNLTPRRPCTNDGDSADATDVGGNLRGRSSLRHPNLAASLHYTGTEIASHGSTCPALGLRSRTGLNPT